MAPRFSVTVQEADFDAGRLQEQLLDGGDRAGAVAAFTGYVRTSSDNRAVNGMLIEHYPGMTEASIEAIIEQAVERWPLLAAAVVHRVGKLSPGDRIVWVGAASRHREAAFADMTTNARYTVVWRPKKGAGWVGIDGGTKSTCGRKTRKARRSKPTIEKL